MIKSFTCIVCPNGCDIDVDLADNDILFITGALCERGKTYVMQELRDPQRTIASSVRVDGGEMPLVSVRVSAAIPKNRIFDVMDAIRSLRVTAPVRLGDVLAAGIVGLECDIVATRHVRKADQAD